MADFGILPEPYEVDQQGDWADFVELITNEELDTPDDLTGATAVVTLVNKKTGVAVTLTPLITLPNKVGWSATKENLGAASSGAYLLKVKITRATGFRQVALRGDVVLVP